MKISVVIPTCNRKESVKRLLTTLSLTEYPLEEVIIVDSGDQHLVQTELSLFNSLNIVYVTISERSVCVQRNIGIRRAQSEWILLCDDDLEVPPDYLTKLVRHQKLHPTAGAVTGQFLQKENNEWTAQYPITSLLELWWRFIFQQSIWGEIDCKDSLFLRPVKRFYDNKGNHLSKAGWPVITNFSGVHFKTPVYTLGASLVRKDWLIDSPFDEVLDPHGIGDNYGVAVGFPQEGIHLLTDAFVYHHQEPANRIVRSSQYFRRGLAVDYFIRTKKQLAHIKPVWFIWSLIGNVIIFLIGRNLSMTKVAIKLLLKVILKDNPYVRGSVAGTKIVEPKI